MNTTEKIIECSPDGTSCLACRKSGADCETENMRQVGCKNNQSEIEKQWWSFLLTGSEEEDPHDGVQIYANSYRQPVFPHPATHNANQGATLHLSPYQERTEDPNIFLSHQVSELGRLHQPYAAEANTLPVVMDNPPCLPSQPVLGFDNPSMTCYVSPEHNDVPMSVDILSCLSGEQLSGMEGRETTLLKVQEQNDPTMAPNEYGVTLRDARTADRGSKKDSGYESIIDGIKPIPYKRTSTACYACRKRKIKVSEP